MVTLSSMSVTPVCHVGDPLQLTCTATVEFKRWSILQANEQGTLVEPVNPVQINSRDNNQMSRIIIMNSSMFTFTRTSAQGDLPLISTLSIGSVGIGLNGTVIRCSDVANPTSSASTIIQIIDISLSEYIDYSLPDEFLVENSAPENVSCMYNAI